MIKQYFYCIGRQGRIRTAVEGFADPYLTARPHDYATNISKVY